MQQINFDILIIEFFFLLFQNMSDSEMREKKRLRQSKEMEHSLSPERPVNLDVTSKRQSHPQSERSVSPPGVPSDDEPRKKDKKKGEKEKEKKRKRKKSTESSEVIIFKS